MLHLRIITPRKVVFEQDVTSVTAPGSEGEVTILPRHTDFFSMLSEGIVTIRSGKQEESLAIGSGYLQTNGKDINILVSRAYGQDEIDEKLTQEAIKRAKEDLVRAKGDQERIDAAMLLRRSTVDLKLLRKKKRISV